MRPIVCLFFAAVAAVASSFSKASGHGLGVLGTGDPAEAAAELAVIFGDDTAFSALTELTVKDDAAQQPRTKEFQYYLLGGKLRIEQDDAKANELPPDVVKERQGKGLDVSVWLYDYPKSLAYLIMPKLEAYTSLRRDEAEPSRPAPKIEKAEIGKETLDGHRCTKYRIKAEEKSGAIEMVTWEAHDLKRLPIQVTVDHGSLHYKVRFKDVKLGKPSPTLFEVPKGYRRYDSVQQILDAANERATK